MFIHIYNSNFTEHLFNENAKIKSKKYMNAKIANHNHLNRLSTDTTVNQETPETSFLAKTQPRASWAGLKG